MERLDYTKKGEILVEIKEGKKRFNLTVLGVVAIVGIVAMALGYMSPNRSYFVSDEFLYDDTEISAAATAPLSKCFDSDGGKNYNTLGFVKLGKNGREIWDFCNSNTELMEYYCVGNDRKRTKYICPNGCQNGACISPPPQLTGICLVRDAYTTVPVFSAPDLGKGYAKTAKPGINTIPGLKSACSRADFSSLLQNYCTQNTNPIQEQVVTYNSQGNYQSLSCGAFGCDYHYCSSLNQTIQCSDGTQNNQCSITKPLYCSTGTLINNCFACGCPSGQTCSNNGACIISPPTNQTNTTNQT